MDKTMKKIILVILAVIAAASLTFGQTNGNFQTVRLKAGLDTATFSPQPNGTILYGNGGFLWFKTATNWVKFFTVSDTINIIKVVADTVDTDYLHATFASIDSMALINVDSINARKINVDTLSASVITAADSLSAALGFVSSLTTNIITNNTTFTLNGGSAAALTVTDSLFSAGKSLLTGIISPPEFTGAVNDWNPTGIKGATVIRIDSDELGSYNLSGIVAQPAGTMIWLTNVAATNIVLLNNSGSSAAGNRFLLPNDGTLPITLVANSSILIWYDGTSGAWRTLGDSN